MPPRSPLTIFTHIDKTAGTSFVDALIRSNIPSDRIFICVGVRSFIEGLRRDSLFISGHTPYGLHILTRRPAEYITFLRDPIDRAVSHYYFARESDGSRGLRHPLCALANSVDIVEFYKRRNVQNLQTRFIAGQAAFYLYPKIPTPRFERHMLNQAIENLTNRFVCFGLQERFEESVLLFRRQFEWKPAVQVEQKMKTQKRADLRDLPEATIIALRKTNALDIALYEIAQARFERMLAANPITDDWQLAGAGLAPS